MIREDNIEYIRKQNDILTKPPKDGEPFDISVVKEGSDYYLYVNIGGNLLKVKMEKVV